MSEPIIGDCPQDGKDYEPCCARCGSFVVWEPCETCGGTGEIDDESHPMHPINTHDGEDETWCLDCDGNGSVLVCISRLEWCEANPLDGREELRRGTVEWFEVKERQQETTEAEADKH